MSDKVSIIAGAICQDPSSSLSSRSKRVEQSSIDVWKEYSSWNEEYCRQTLQSLSRPVSRHPDADSGNTKSKRPKRSSPAIAGTCTISDYVDGLQSSSKEYSVDAQIISPKELELDKAIPYPPYHNCASISQNILVGDDSDYLPFIPFADDESYEFSRDFELHYYNAWQKRHLTFDAQYILFETTRRLLSDGTLCCMKDIDETSILPLACHEIMKFQQKCDIPKSFPFQGTIPPMYQENSPTSTVGYFLEYFCSNLNCTMGFCPSHEGDAAKAQISTYIPSKLPSPSLATTISAACSPSCALLPSLPPNLISTTWNDEDRELLTTALRFAPHTTSCDLAVICDKPCHEIERLRKTLKLPIVRSRTATKTRQQAQVKSRSFRLSSPFFATDTVADPFIQHQRTADRTASHQICLADTKGLATLPRVNATEIKDTVIQGVDATNPAQEDGKAVLVRNLKRFAAQRSVRAIEPISSAIQKYASPVDQEVGFVFQYEYSKLDRLSTDDMNNLCKNTGIQRGAFKDTEVRESKFGLGLFMSEDCEEEDLISEYVGEMIGPLTVESRNVRAEHRQRSYVFHMNPTYALDSVYAGNTTRYMNHSTNTSNCHTRVMFINGEHRIGVYAARRIAKGEELLIDYGIDFWKSGQDPSADSDPSLPPPTFEDPKDLTYHDPSPDGTLD